VANGFRQDIACLLGLLEDSGVETRRETGDLLGALCDSIERWNKAVNLVSRKDIQRLVSYHLCDSASILPILRLNSAVAMLDIGGSNGLPGLAISAISPYVAVTVCDSKLKRRGFLEEACAGLGSGAVFELARADSDDFRSEHTESFDIVVARAVTKLKQLIRWCMPLLRPGGYLVAYKGSRCPAEAEQAEAELIRTGGNLLTVIGSPWAEVCNPLRVFAIAGKGLE
jgi:16S rRNA (guanine527-N7)-methyltransferase